MKILTTGRIFFYKIIFFSYIFFIILNIKSFDEELSAKLQIVEKEEEEKPIEQSKFFIFKNIDVNYPLQKRRSLKDEFTLLKSLQQDDQEELSSETIAETMKNTLYNKVMGKFHEEQQ